MNRCFGVIVAAVFFLGGCSSTFVMSKDGIGYVWGSDSTSMYKRLCESGDLKKVLSDTALPMERKEEVYAFNCSSGRSGEKIRQLYAGMTTEQRKDLRDAFRKNGYDINYIPCCDVVNSTSGGI